MEYEYVALTWDTERRTQDKSYVADYQRLSTAGFERIEWGHFEPERVGGSCIMRRELSRDEPRMWTEKGLVALMKQTWLVDPSPRQHMKEETNG